MPDIPYSLEQIILKCTQKNGERRYSNTSDLIQDLKRSLVDPDGDFVVIPPLRSADTVIITDEELDNIRDSYDDEYDDEYDDNEYEDGYDDDEYDDDEYDHDEYGDDDEYDDDEYDRKKRGSEEVNPRMNKVMKILTIVVAVIIVFIAIFAIGKAAGIFKGFGSGITAEESEDKVKVPNVIGKTEEEAEKILNDKKLGFRVVTRKESKKYEKGLVIEQSVEAGEKVKKNTTIEVVISSELVGDQITVPSVAGMDEAEAQKKLEAEGLKVGTSEAVYSDQYEEGVVIGTTPAAGSKVSEDTEIVMQVSKGSEKISVPNVVGKSDSDAQSMIKSAKLKVGTVTYEYDDSVAEGKVVSQSVAGGKKVSAGTTIDIVVSRGKKPEEKVSVQSFVGRDEEELLDWAYANGLNASKQSEEYSNNYPEGMIISMTPSSGNVSKGSTIEYVLSLGPKSSGSGGSDSETEE